MQNGFMVDTKNLIGLRFGLTFRSTLLISDADYIAWQFGANINCNEKRMLGNTAIEIAVLQNSSYGEH